MAGVIMVRPMRSDVDGGDALAIQNAQVSKGQIA